MEEPGVSKLVSVAVNEAAQVRGAQTATGTDTAAVA